MPDAIVVGYGLNGLAAAIQVARAGRTDAVYEANDEIGGGVRSAALTQRGNLAAGAAVWVAMRRLLLAACVVSTACAPVTDVSRQTSPLPLAKGSPIASSSRGAAAASPEREPATLPVFPEEALVIAALDTAQIRLTLIGGPKFEALLGERQRARVFIEQAGGSGADVLFLERPISGIRVCRSKTAAGLDRTEVFIGDRLVSSGEGTQIPLYSVSDRYFIQAFGKRFSDALMAGLGTVTPPC